MNDQKKRISIKLIFFFVFTVFYSISYATDTYESYMEVGLDRYFNQKSKIVDRYDLFIPLLYKNNKLFFTDLRIFGRSSGSFESNIHVGLRNLYPNEEEMIGVYAAYDCKRSSNKNWFNQIMIGGEYWNGRWFIGGNIYRPLGDTKKNININADVSEIDSKAIGITRYHEEALPGADAEVGYSLKDSLTGYVGIYYFHASDTSSAIGPRARFVYNYNKPDDRVFGILDGVSVEVGVQHDRTRGTTAHVGINFRVGITPLEDNSNVSGFKRHMVDLVRRDLD